MALAYQQEGLNSIQTVTTRHILGDHQNTFSFFLDSKFNPKRKHLCLNLFPQRHRKYITRNIPDNNALKSEVKNYTFTLKTKWFLKTM